VLVFTFLLDLIWPDILLKTFVVKLVFTRQRRLSNLLYVGSRPNLYLV